MKKVQILVLGEEAKVLITVIFPINVNFLCCHSYRQHFHSNYSRVERKTMVTQTYF